eukprot:3935678-Karenia_brevis.AAC.1
MCISDLALPDATCVTSSTFSACQSAHDGTETMREPQWTACMADPGKFYHYSNGDNEGIGWHPEALKIKDKA